MEIRINYQDKATVLKALSNPVRLQIVHGLLLAGCRNVGCMERSIGMSQSCISQHLQKLRSEGILSAERTGNEVYYRVSSQEAARIVAALLGEEVDQYAI